jgi:hypothetical protein
MGKRYPDHYIGEPVGDVVDRFTGRKVNYPPGNIRARFRKITIIRSIIMMLVMLLLPLAFVIPMMMTTGMGIQFLILLYGVFGIAFIIAIPISFFTIHRLMKKYDHMGARLLEGEIYILSVYSINTPQVILRIPYSNVLSIRKLGSKDWAEIKRRSPAWFNLLNRSPIPPQEGLYTIFSQPEDMLVLELKRTIKLEKMDPPRGFGIPGMKTYRVNNLILDVDRNHHAEFMEKIEKKIGRDGR